MIDKEDANIDLAGQLLDAALAVRELRGEGKQCCCTACMATPERPSSSPRGGAATCIVRTQVHQVGRRREGCQTALPAGSLRWWRPRERLGLQ